MAWTRLMGYVQKLRKLNDAWLCFSRAGKKMAAPTQREGQVTLAQPSRRGNARLYNPRGTAGWNVLYFVYLCALVTRARNFPRRSGACPSMFRKNSQSGLVQPFRCKGGIVSPGTYPPASGEVTDRRSAANGALSSKRMTPSFSDMPNCCSAPWRSMTTGRSLSAS